MVLTTLNNRSARRKQSELVWATLFLTLLALVAFRPTQVPYLVAIYRQVLKTADPEVLPKGLRFNGAGAFIAPTLVLTAAHVLPHKNWEDDEYVHQVIRQSKIQILVKVKGKLFKVKVVINPPDADIAVLKVMGVRATDYLPVTFEQPSAGTTLKVISWRPMQNAPTPTLMPKVWDLTVDNPNLKRTWGVTEPAQEELIYGHPQAWQGASGSPALLNGKVVGVVVGLTGDNHTLIEPTRKIQKQLKPLIQSH